MCCVRHESVPGGWRLRPSQPVRHCAGSAVRAAVCAVGRVAAFAVFALALPCADARGGAADFSAASTRAVTDDLAPADIIARADEHRGVARPHRFLARIFPDGEDAAGPPVGERPGGTLVEVRSNGLARQLVLVLAPNRGDVLLATPDVVWLRPRRLHRLTRIPPDLRMFNGASVSDVTTVDLRGGYRATLRESSAEAADAYVLDLEAAQDGIRYPRATYWIGRDDFRPRRIEFMAASGRRLKTVVYTDFATVLGQTAPTRLVVEDHVHRDSSVVEMSEFALLGAVDPGMFLPDYLLTLPDPTS